MASLIDDGAHVLVVPFPASGHLLPLLDLTHQLAIRGLTITILVTPKNLPYLDDLLSLHPSIRTLVLPFPPQPSLPTGVENMQEVPIAFLPDMAIALAQLCDPVLQWFENHISPPVAIIADLFCILWTQQLATTLGIKLIVFGVVNANALHSWYFSEEDYPKFYKDILRAVNKSWGVIFNSFTGLESEKLDAIQADALENGMVWAVGPLLPFKYSQESIFERGGPSSVPINHLMAWLESQVDESVVYVGFGSQVTLNKQQMEAIAQALEKSKVQFIWVVKDPMKGMQDEGDQSLLPTGFEDRVAGKGLVIRGWAPQAAILRHRAIGSYLTHCGWNSVLEGLLGGVLLLAWPMQADHYFNAELLVDQMGAAIRVCEGLRIIPDSTKLAHVLRNSVSNDCPERIQVKKLHQKAIDAIQEVGSSYEALDGLVKQISDWNREKKKMKHNKRA